MIDNPPMQINSVAKQEPFLIWIHLIVVSPLPCCTIPQGFPRGFFLRRLRSGHRSNQHVIAVHFHHDLPEHALSLRCPHPFPEDPFHAGKESFDLPSHPVGGYPRLYPIFAQPYLCSLTHSV